MDFDPFSLMASSRPSSPAVEEIISPLTASLSRRRLKSGRSMPSGNIEGVFSRTLSKEEAPHITSINELVQLGDRIAEGGEASVYQIQGHNSLVVRLADSPSSLGRLFGEHTPSRVLAPIPVKPEFLISLCERGKTPEVYRKAEGDLNTFSPLVRRFLQDKEHDLSERKALLLRLVENIFECTAQLFSSEILHNDFKLENLLVFPNGIIRIIDFELARRFSDTPPVWGDRLLSIDTANPEKLSRKRPLNSNSDMWDTAASVVRLMTGSHYYNYLSHERRSSRDFSTQGQEGTVLSYLRENTDIDDKSPESLETQNHIMSGVLRDLSTQKTLCSKEAEDLPVDKDIVEFVEKFLYLVLQLTQENVPLP